MRVAHPLSSKGARLGSVKNQRPLGTRGGGSAIPTLAVQGNPSILPSKNLVRAAGVEPAPPCGERILSPLRLPISPRPQTPLVSVSYTDMGLWAPKYAGFSCCKSLQHNTTNFHRVPTAPSAFVRGFYPPGWARTLRALSDIKRGLLRAFSHLKAICGPYLMAFSGAVNPPA